MRRGAGPGTALFRMRNKLVYARWTFEDVKLTAGDEHREQALDSAALGIDTLEVEVKCDDPAIVQFTQNAPMTYYYRGRQRGIYYLQSVTRVSPDHYVISGVSTLGRLGQMVHVGGVYTGQTVREVVEDICGGIPVKVKSNLSGIALYGWLPYTKPPNSSARDNLKQVLFAVGAYLSTDLDGVLRVESLWDGLSSSIILDRIYHGGSVKYGATVTAVTVMEHQYIPGNEAKELFSGTTQENDVITFSDPVTSLRAEGFTILESGANYARVSAGNGTLTGTPYIHTTRQVTEPVQNAAATVNEKTKNDATLVSVVNSRAVAKRLAAYYRCIQTIDLSVTGRGEKPGHVISIYHPYEETMVKACIVNMDSSMSATLKSELQALVNFTPQRAENAELFDYRLQANANQQFVAPENSSYVRGVLISGGTGGQGGANGTDGSQGGGAYIDSGQNGTQSGTQATPGQGGARGAAGNGGRVSIVDIPVAPGDVLTISVGEGGLGGINGAAGSPGTDTTISVNGKIYSSADGSSVAEGYIDPVTGDVYAKPGENGIAGGDGGSPGSATSAGGAGSSVGKYDGGQGNTSALITGQSSATGAWVFNQNTISTQISSTTTITTATSYTGAAEYIVGAEGTLSTGSRSIQIGSISGQIIAGTIYQSPQNGSVSSDGIAISSIRFITVEQIGSLTNQFRKIEGVITSRRTYTRSTAKYLTAILPGGGGGAAVGANGQNATMSCAGGAGANAAAPATPTSPGSGGNGGHGGGGGGAGGAGYVEISGNDSTVGLSKSASGAPGGAAGAGSPGSAGAKGCAILFYGTKRIIKNGPIVTKDSKWFLDRFGRRFIV